MVKRLPAVQETRVRFLDSEDPLGKEIATHSSTLAWKIPWTEEPGRLQSMGSQRVRHDWATSLSDCSHASLPCPSPSLGVCSNSYPLSQWCYLTNSSSAPSFFLCLQSSSASQSFPMSQLFASGGQSTGALASVLPTNNQGRFPWGFTGFISSLSKGLSRVFSRTTIQKHQFFSIRASLWPNSHICTWLLEKP